MVVTETCTCTHAARLHNIYFLQYPPSSSIIRSSIYTLLYIYILLPVAKSVAVSCSTPPQSESRVPAGLCNVRDLIIYHQIVFPCS
jgi:hypothetical protein